MLDDAARVVEIECAVCKRQRTDVDEHFEGLAEKKIADLTALTKDATAKMETAVKNAERKTVQEYSDKLAEAELKIQQLEKTTGGELKLKPLAAELAEE